MAHFKAVQPVDPQKRIKKLQSEIAQLEKRFSMSTAKMLRRMCAGELNANKQFASWQKKYMILCAHLANVQATR